MIQILLLSLVFLSTFALKKSPNGGNGFFIELEKYSPEVYGSVPFAVDHHNLPQNLISPHVLLIPQLELDTAEFHQLPKRTRIYNQRVQFMTFMAQKVISEFNLVDAEIMWIQPLIYVRNSQQISMFDKHPQIKRIIPNDVVAEVALLGDMPQSSGPVPADSFTVQGSTITAWGVAKIGADQAWAKTRGEGVRIGIIDTGVNYLHHALNASYAGKVSPTEYNHDYSWFDPKEFRDDEWWCDPDFPCLLRECCLEEPFDIIGHGTHVTSTAAGVPFYNGTNMVQVGVAPGAKWIAAKGCRDGNCLQYGLLKSAQWMACPTKIDGSGPNCELGADVVNNSWGSKNPEDNFYKDVVAVWRQFGIIPVFAAGNHGPSCGSMSAPGDFANVIGVAASTIDDKLAEFSSRGPGPVDKDGNDPLFGYNKPDMTAPGFKVLAASIFANDTVVTMSGTSMATPHVTGAVALILSYLRQERPSDTTQLRMTPHKDANYDTVLKTICSTAVTDLQEPIGGGGRVFPFPGFPVRKQCANTSPSVFPNMFYGCGQINALKALGSQ